MNRKAESGFTLAEILIALVVIGVIAAMTLPSMIVDIQNAQYKTAYKKMYSELSQAASKIMIDNGGTLINAFTDDNDAMNKFGNYISISKICLYWQEEGNCWPRSNDYDNNISFLYNYNKHDNWGYEHYSIDYWRYYGARAILSNGKTLLTWIGNPKCDFNSLPVKNICGGMYLDVNGLKSPNVMGIDVFQIFITKDGLAPEGKNKTLEAINEDCIEPGQPGWDNTANWGFTCAAKYLMQ